MLDEKTRLFYCAKVALALRELKKMNAVHNKKIEKDNLSTDVRNDSYDKIASEIDMRTATISNLFNFRDDAQISTLVATIMGMERSMEEFGKTFDSISEQEVIRFLEKKA